MRTVQGTRCKRGHDGERYRGGGCVQCAKDRSARVHANTPPRAHAPRKSESVEHTKARRRRLPRGCGRTSGAVRRGLLTRLTGSERTAISVR